MLWEEMEKYTELTGEDATHVPIIKIGAYLDGYDKGLEVLDKIRAEILEEHENAYAREDYDTAYGLSMALDILDKYKAETEDT